jgi:imidazolonepropionase-like amidohydrolase
MARSAKRISVKSLLAWTGSFAWEFLVLAAFLANATKCILAQNSQLLIENVTLIDGTQRPPREHACILIRDARVTAVMACPLRVPDKIQRIDGSGKFLIPGLMDVHIHLGKGLFDSGLSEINAVRLLQGYLYCGVTTVMDLGNDDTYIFGLRERQRAGVFVGPRLFASGGIVTYLGGAGDTNPSATVLDGWPQAISKIDAHIGLEPDMVSIIYDGRGWGKYSLVPIMPIDLEREVLDKYASHGIRSTAHLFSELRAREAIESGLDTLANTIIEAPVSEGFVKLMAEKHTPIASALSSFDELERLMDHPDFLDQPLYQATLEPTTIQQLRSTYRHSLLESPWWGRWRGLMEPVGAENLSRINAAGGTVALGTDVSVGPAVQREAQLLAKAGISTGDIIRIATLNSAVFLGKERDLGSIEEGKLADMVLLDADPLEDVQNLGKIDTVILNGKIVDRSSLDLPINRLSMTPLAH